MSQLRRFFRRLDSFLRPARAEDELAREVAAHRALLEDEYRLRGLAADEARVAAARAFGGVELSKDRQRDARSFVWLEDARRDVGYAARLLGRSPAFTAVALLTLAVSIGANTAIFTIVRSVLLRPLPFPASERLVFSYDRFPGGGVERAGTSIPNYIDRLTAVSAFESQALYRYAGFRIGEGAAAEGVTAFAVTPSFFRVLSVAPQLGRPFAEQEGREGHARVAILSFELWKQAFGGDRGILGRDVRLSGEPYTVVGVMPEDFTFLNPVVRLYVPLTFSAEDLPEASRFSQNQEQIARLAPGASVAQAQQQVDALNARIVERMGELKPLLLNTGYGTRVVSLSEDLVRRVRPTLQLLWGGVLLVLLIASANITNLVLVRAAARTRELVTRQALGAGERRIARQLLAETLLLTLVGGVLGLVAGAWSLGWLTSLGIADLPRGHEIRLDWVVVAFVLALAIVQAVVIGLAPLAQLAGLNFSTALREEGRTSTAGRGAGLIRRGLVAVQVALAFVLLISAGLLFTSFRQLLAVDPGFSAEHVLTGSIGLPAGRYQTEAEQAAVVHRALAEIRRLPGVISAGGTTFLPFGYTNASGGILVEGYTMAPDESLLSPNQLRVTPGFFEALGIPLRRGRYFTEHDTAGSPPVAIVDERLARRFWPGRDPIGGRIFKPESADELSAPIPEERWMRVVGVVAEVKLRELVAGEDTRIGAYYFPYAQSPEHHVSFVVRTSGDPMAAAGAVRQAFTRVDPELLFEDVAAMPERIERTLHGRRLPMLLSLAFGAIALLLAAIGIYGVLAYQVSQRTREIGIRMALGGDAADVLRLILREGAVLVGIGLAAGIAGVVGLRQVIASQLYGIGALDPVVLTAVGATLMLTALAACAIPARRASRVNPVEALSAP